MTQINFERTSGLVGRPLRYTVNLDNLPEDEAQILQRLIDEANFFELPSNLRGNATPDEFQYRLTVQNGNQEHTVQASDTTMPRSLVPLIKELTILKMLR
ncbi:MAG: protealysin inhibitor emfourin [Chloroflexota bacterium]